MIKKNNDIKKVCNFSVSDGHLTVALLKYLDKEIDKNKNIVTFFDRNMEESVGRLLNNNSFDIKNKKDIKEINWKGNSNENSRKLENDSNEKIYIVSGKEDYINNVNNKIESLYNNKLGKDVKIINCYNVSELNNHLGKVLNKYDTMLNTTGEISMLDILKENDF